MDHTKFSMQNNVEVGTIILMTVWAVLSLTCEEEKRKKTNALLADLINNTNTVINIKSLSS
jgi:hypothetical protein